jgi:hypothetical protein
VNEKTVVACFLGTLAFITYRDFRKPDPTWPLGPVPPPYRFTYAGVVFGILLIVSDMFSPKIAGVVSVGVLVGTAFTVFRGDSASAGLKSNAPKPSANPNPSTSGLSGSTPANGGVQQT